MNSPLGFSLILAKAKRMIDSLLFWLKPFVCFYLIHEAYASGN